MPTTAPIATLNGSGTFVTSISPLAVGALGTLNAHGSVAISRVGFLIISLVDNFGNVWGEQVLSISKTDMMIGTKSFELSWIFGTASSVLSPSGVLTLITIPTFFQISISTRTPDDSVINPVITSATLQSAVLA